MRSYKKLIDPARVPGHVAIIMDGNGRWADRRGLSRTEGHRKGSRAVEPVVKAAIETGIRAISLFAFSTENWSRPSTEIRSLWNLLEYFFNTTFESIKENDIKIIHSGSMDGLPSKTRRIIENTIEETKNNKKIILNLCVNYGARQEIATAVNRVLEKKPGRRITAEAIERNLFTSELPELDLLIRTSGESRVSNFMLWQLAYSELIFTKVLWPDFKPAHLYKAVYDYQSRKRRFGGL